MSEEAGTTEPIVRDAVRELLIEAADTPTRLADRERRWLGSGTHSFWPRTVRDYGAAFVVT